MDIYYPAERPHRPAPPAAATLIPAFDSSSDALNWLNEERPNLLAVAQHAAFHGSPVHAVGLSGVLYRPLSSIGNGTDGLALHSHARRAAVAAGDRHGEALALLGVGTALMQVCRFETAVERLTESAEMFRQQGDPIGEGRHSTRWASPTGPGDGSRQPCRTTTPSSGCSDGQASPAARDTRSPASARRRGSSAGAPRQPTTTNRPSWSTAGQGKASALDSLGGAHHRLGDHGRAANCFARSVEAFRRIGCHDFAWPLAGLGELALDEGRPAAALAGFTEVLGLADETGSRLVEAQAHSGVGRAHHALGNLLLAREHCTRALQIFHELEIRDTLQLEKLRAVLTGNST